MSILRILVHPIRILWAGSSYLIFAGVGAVIGYLLLPVFTLGIRDEMQRVRRGQIVLSWLCRIWIGYMTLGGLVGLKKRPLPSIEPGRPCVVIANHPSLLDIIMLIAAVPHITFLAKASFFRSPFVGPLLRFGRHIPGPEGGTQGDPAEGAAVLERILGRLAEGYPVMLFPEGTRSPAGELRAFKRGAFEAALRARVPLHCLLLRVDPPALLKGQAWWELPLHRIRYRLSCLCSLQPEQLPASSRDLRTLVRHQYLDGLGISPSPGRPGGSA